MGWGSESPPILLNGFNPPPSREQTVMGPVFARSCPCGREHISPVDALEQARQEQLTLKTKAALAGSAQPSNIYVGVHAVQNKTHPWEARLIISRKHRFLGTHKCPEEAALAIARARREAGQACDVRKQPKPSGAHWRRLKRENAGALCIATDEPSRHGDVPRREVRLESSEHAVTASSYCAVPVSENAEALCVATDEPSRHRDVPQREVRLESSEHAVTASSYCAVPVSSRVKGEEYPTKMGKRRWLGKQWSCKCGKLPSICAECGGWQLCRHGQRRGECKKDECKAVARERNRVKKDCIPLAVHAQMVDNLVGM